MTYLSTFDGEKGNKEKKGIKERELQAWLSIYYLSIHLFLSFFPSCPIQDVLIQRASIQYRVGGRSQPDWSNALHKEQLFLPDDYELRYGMNGWMNAFTINEMHQFCIRICEAVVVSYSSMNPVSFFPRWVLKSALHSIT